MLDTMDEVTCFSAEGGTLVYEKVKGSDRQFITPENSVITEQGSDRDMYVYIPESGCYDAKQCQVLYVLRDKATRESAEQLLSQLGLDSLAEQRHCILLFPNPQEDGWNYTRDQTRDDDCAFLVRCFAALPKTKAKIAGFNGMMFYIAASEAASAMLGVMTSLSPINCAALMLGRFPEGWHLPEGLKQPQTAWLYEENLEMEEYLKQVNGPCRYENGTYISAENENVRVTVRRSVLNQAEAAMAFEEMFSISRRWRNDTYGHYQSRTDFAKEGFIAHVNDTSLHVNSDFPHTWYEYVPDIVKREGKKVPLVFYFHGGNCIPLYGAEQSQWHTIAKREGFITVYPKASTKKRWNVWNDPSEPSDMDFILALIQHLKEIYPVDESRIYISGFSMGSMFTNALACVYPDIFAAGAACNAQNLGYFNNIYSTFRSLDMMPKEMELTEEQLSTLSETHIMADAKKKEKDYRMPLIQQSGQLDDLGMADGWPIRDETDIWLETIDYWKAYNHIPVKQYVFDETNESGLSADRTYYDGEDERFLHHVWYSSDTKQPLYEFVLAKRMPHAVDLRQIELGWQFMKHYRREADGTLTRDENL